MEAFRKGDIVLFPFPYTDLTSRKLRPCLVISDEMSEDLILCQITSKNIRKDNHTLELKKDETINGTLAIDSYIRCNMIFTASKHQILRKICAINDTKYAKVVSALSAIFSK